jgi:hypothetical protein
LLPLELARRSRIADSRLQYYLTPANFGEFAFHALELIREKRIRVLGSLGVS